MIKYLLFWGLFSMLFTFCNNNKHEVKMPESTLKKDSVITNKFDVKEMDNKNDPICGMPISAGIEDTIHYNKKVLGFCSSECKQAYNKNRKGFTIEYK